MMDAFGVERPDLVSKVGSELVRSTRAAYVGENLVGHGIGGPKGPGAGARRGGPKREKRYAATEFQNRGGQTRRGEFGRGFKGGTMGGSTTRTTLDGARVPFGERKGRRTAYRAARDGARSQSQRQGSFSAGERTGRGVAYAADHPFQLYGGAGATVVGATAVADHKQASGEVKRKKQLEPIKKGLSAGVKDGLKAGGLVGGIAGADYVAVAEINRRVGNRRGANVGTKESYRHPIRTSHKVNSANWRHLAESADKQADRTHAGAAGKRTPHGQEVARIRGDRARSNANVARYNSTVYNTAAIHGARRAHKAGMNERFDPKKQYSAPETIGKSDAFGVPRPDLVSKAMPSFGAARKVVGEFAGGFKHAQAGGSFGGSKGGTAGSLGAKTGKLAPLGTQAKLTQGANFASANRKPLAIGAIGGGAVVGGGALLNQDRR